MTRHGSPVDRSQLVDFQPLDPHNRPAPFKRYVGRAPAPLPTDIEAPASGGRLDRRSLARLLFFTGGVTRVTESAGLDGRAYFRTAMSAGNLHPVELYVVSGGGGDVPAGAHHYAPLEHGLTPLRDGAVGGGTSVVLTGIPWRTSWKYGERGYRHLFWDAGTMLANLLAIADADGIPAHVQLGFVDDDVARLLGVDGATEYPLAVVSLGEAGDLSAWSGADEITVDVEPISTHPIEFPLVAATHRAGALATAAEVDEWRRAAAGLGQRAQQVPAAASGAIEEVILRRGSTRMMRQEEAPRELLAQAMATAAQPVAGDFVGADRTLLEHELSVHAVHGVPPGAYRWRPGGELELVHEGDSREAAQLLCLRQPLGGDSAYTVFHAADLDAVLGALGTRGYRAAQLEAGVASGRLSLAAFALGFGATGLTFFDDAVAHFFETSAACMLVTSVGVPAYRNTAGGLPGRTATLAGYEQLMNRLSLELRRR